MFWWIVFSFKTTNTAVDVPWQHCFEENTPDVLALDSFHRTFIHGTTFLDNFSEISNVDTNPPYLVFCLIIHSFNRDDIVDCPRSFVINWEAEEITYVLPLKLGLKFVSGALLEVLDQCLHVFREFLHNFLRFFVHSRGKIIFIEAFVDHDILLSDVKIIDTSKWAITFILLIIFITVFQAAKW